MDHGQCLNDETLTEYLEGALDPVVTAACEVHLIGCDHCRAELALFMRVLQSGSTPREDQEIKRIADIWDRRKSQTPPAEKTSTGAGSKRGLIAVGGIAVAAAFGLLLFWSSMRGPAEPQTAGEVVQLLLSQSRPSEFRLDDQPYLPFVRTRGTEEPGVDFDLIAGEMTRLAADSYQMGRFYLLQKDFDRAISQLEEAEKQPGAAAAVHNDLGVAYMERGGEINLRKAADEFRRALQADPDLAPAIFNLAISDERTGTLSEAQMLWRRYLQLDSNSGWAGEARSKLEDMSR